MLLQDLVFNLLSDTNPASRMMTLVRLLPFVIGEFVEGDDEHWSCFLLLWDICCLSTAFEVTKADATQLTWLIEVYLESFTSLYAVSVIPKMHFLIHLPEQILRYMYVHCLARYLVNDAPDGCPYTLAHPLD